MPPRYLSPVPSLELSAGVEAQAYAIEALRERGLDSLQDHRVVDHEGKPVSLHEAIAVCGRPVLNALDSAVAMGKAFGADALTAATKFVEQQAPTVKAETSDAFLKSAPIQ